MPEFLPCFGCVASTGEEGGACLNVPALSWPFFCCSGRDILTAPCCCACATASGGAFWASIAALIAPKANTPYAVDFIVIPLRRAVQLAGLRVCSYIRPR